MSKSLQKYGEEMDRGVWERFLKYYKGNVKRTLKYLIKEEKRMLINSKILSNKKIKFFKKLAKGASQT